MAEEYNTQVILDILPELDGFRSAIAEIKEYIKSVLDFESIIKFKLENFEPIKNILDDLKKPVELKIKASTIDSSSIDSFRNGIKTDIPVFFQIQNYKQIQEAKKLLSKKMMIPVNFRLNDIPDLQKVIPDVEVQVDTKVNQQSVNKSSDQIKKGLSTSLKGLGSLIGGSILVGFVKKILPMKELLGDTFKPLENSAFKLKQSLIDAVKPMIQSLKPLVEWITKITDSITKWIDENPKLARILGAVALAVIGVTVAVGALTVAIGIMEAVAAPVTLIALAIAAALAALTFIVWDLWNGMEGGNSVIAETIAGFLQWLGIGVEAQDVLNAIGEVFNWLADLVMNYVVPIIVSQFQFMYDMFAEQLAFMANITKSVVTIIVGLFTGDMQKAGQGFKMLGASAKIGFLGIVKAALVAMKKVLEIVSKGISKIAEALKDVPFLGDIAGGLKSKVLSLDVSVDMAIDNVGGKRDSLAKQYGLTTGQEVQDYAASKIGGMAGGGSAKNRTIPGKNSAGGGAGASSGGGAGGAGKDLTQEIMMLETMKGIQDLIKELGFDVKDIKNKEIFDVTRQGKIDTMKRTETSKDFLDKYISNIVKISNETLNNNNSTSNNSEIIINFQGQQGILRSNNPNINGETKLKDVARINSLQQGG